MQESALEQLKLEVEWAQDAQKRAKDELAARKTKLVCDPYYTRVCARRSMVQGCNRSCDGSQTTGIRSCMQVGGVAYDLESACQELDRLSGQVKMLQAVSEAYKAAERSADDVYHIALQDMSAQLQTAASDRAACQTAIIKLQECVPDALTRARTVGSGQNEVPTLVYIHDAYHSLSTNIILSFYREMCTLAGTSQTWKRDTWSISRSLKTRLREQKRSESLLSLS